MICFKRKTLVVLMIIVNVMSFNRVMAPTNEGFQNCFNQLQNNFLLFGNEAFVSPDSQLQCIKNAIMYLSENDNLDTDLRDYYNTFPGIVNGDEIIDRKTFCAEITDAILDPSAKTDPAKYLFEYLKAQTIQISPSMYLFKLSEAETKGDKDEQTEKCVRELDVFGSPTASNNEILDLAIRKYRISFNNEKLDHIFGVTSYGCQYLIHISEVVVLKRYIKLVTPWDYCCDRHPVHKQDNVKPEDQASSNTQETK